MFYDLCDENGILVWQDFMFSGSMQPGDSAHLENIRLEAIENIKRLRNHPCLALWCGNNETMINWNNLEWKNNYPKDTATKIQSNYEKIFYHILPEAVNSYDPETDYLASSPSPENNALPDVKSGDVHDWEIWTGNAPVQEYGKTSVPFASEYGLQSFPSMKTINSFSQKSDQQVHSKLMDFKQRNLLPKGNPKMNGNEKILEFIKNQYREPETFESLVYLSQVTQAEALKTAIENHRKSMPFCMGSLYRQLNDCWPTMSWSTVDFYGRWKLSHYSVRDAFSPILVVPVKENKHINIQAISDLTKDLEAILFVKLIDFNGKSLYVKQIPVKIKSNSSSQVLSLDEEVVLAKADKRNCCLIVQLNQPNKTLSQNILYFTEPKNLMLAKPHIDIVVNEAVKGYNLILKSEVLAKNIFLETSKKECSFADNNFDLLPGKRTKINVRYVGTKDEFIHDLKIISLADVY
jgi:beta-mannosidase